jgi:hypothetical protein
MLMIPKGGFVMQSWLAGLQWGTVSDWISALVNLGLLIVAIVALNGWKHQIVKSERRDLAWDILGKLEKLEELSRHFEIYLELGEVSKGERFHDEIINSYYDLKGELTKFIENFFKYERIFNKKYMHFTNASAALQKAWHDKMLENISEKKSEEVFSAIPSLKQNIDDLHRSVQTMKADVDESLFSLYKVR